MNRAALVVALALAVACGGDSNQPHISAASTVGQWTGHVGDAAGCWPAFDIRFDITSAQAASVTSDGAFFIVSGPGWYIGSTGPLPYTGTVRLDGQASTLKFWKQVLVAGGSVTAVVQRDGSHMTGTFVDEGHAFSLNSGCGASFNASK